MPLNSSNRGGNGYFQVPPKRAKAELSPDPAEPKLTSKPFEACDRCGFAFDGCPISRAKHVVRVRAGVLYFCDHHFKEHALVLIAANYRVVLV